jgi:hypothetical protein
VSTVSRRRSGWNRPEPDGGARGMIVVDERERGRRRG